MTEQEKDPLQMLVTWCDTTGGSVMARTRCGRYSVLLEGPGAMRMVVGQSNDLGTAVLDAIYKWNGEDE